MIQLLKLLKCHFNNTSTLNCKGKLCVCVLFENQQKMVSACLCQATVRKTGLPCLRKTKAGVDFCGYHQNQAPKKQAPPKQQESEKEPDCSICLCAVNKDKWITPCCKQAFHKKCIDPWKSSKQTCPLCRHRFESTTVYSGASARARLASVSLETVANRLEEFRRTHPYADTFLRVGPFYIASYRQTTPDIYILDTSTNQVSRTRRLEIVV